MPFIISNPTAGLFTSLTASPTSGQLRPSFSKRPNAPFTFYPTKGEALSALSLFPPHIAGACSIFETSRDFASINSLLAYIARQPKKRLTRSLSGGRLH